MIDVSFYGFLSAVIRNGKLVVGCAVTGAVLVSSLTLLRKNYIASSSFTPQVSENAAGRFAGLAAQIGLNIGNVSGEESISFYAELVRSRELLTQVALTRYLCSKHLSQGDAAQGTIVELYRIKGDTPGEQLLNAVEFLDRKITVTTDLKAGLITVETEARCSDLAVQVNRRILDLVNDFNLKKRQSQASAERQFVETRLDQAREELATAEGDLRRFLEQNRRYQDAPQLAFEMARLQRTVDLRQQVYTSLAQSFEQARIEEVRNTPVITVVDQPEGSARLGRSIARAVVAGMILGGLFGAVVAFVRGYAALERSNNPTQYAEFRKLREALVAKARLGWPLRKGDTGGLGSG